MIITKWHDGKMNIEKTYIEYTNYIYDHFKFDVVKVINFDNNSISGEQYNIDENIKNQIDEGNIVYYDINDNDDTYKRFISSTKCEIYIPIISSTSISQKVDGCVYLGTYNNATIDLNEIINNEIIINFITISQIIFFKATLDNFSSNFVNFVSEITKDREPFMVNHPYKVAEYSVLIGEKLNLSSEDLSILNYASIVHDIGKLLISESLLNKDGPLTDEEFDIVKNHTIYGANLLRNFEIFESKFNNISEIIECHHERYDGKGYPNGFKGQDIPYLSRIICIADATDAMLSLRSYKSPKRVEDVIRILKKEAGRQFDPIITNFMIDILNDTLEGEVITSNITWGTLNIYTDNKIYVVQGTIKKDNGNHIFESNKFNFNLDFDIKELIKTSLYIDKNGNIKEYTVRFNKLLDNYMYISELKFVNNDNFFSIFWQLDGQVFLPNGIHSIEILKIGGSGLSFSIQELNLNHIIGNEIFKIKINFQQPLTVTGKIINKKIIGRKEFYDFEFVNVPESTQDKIIKLIFEKQIKKKVRLK